MSPTHLNELLLGTWELVAYDVAGAGGIQCQPFGPEPVGLLIYAADGHMSAQLARRDRPAIRDGEQQGETNYIAYCGTYNVDDAGSSVAHHVSLSLDPKWAGHTLHRAIHWNSDVLVLTAEVPGPNAERSRHELTWRRISSGHN